MRLSPFHIELAKMWAKGMRNRDIKKIVKISDSRLSVIKSNDLVRQKIQEFAELEQSKYNKALEHFKDEALDIAKEVVKVVKSVNTPAKVRLDGGLEILDRIAASEGVSSTNKGAASDNEIVFEQMLRVTKRGMAGLDEIEPESEIDAEQALKDLEQDLIPVDENEDFLPEPTSEQVSFVKTLKDAVSEKPMPTIRDNGGSKPKTGSYPINPELAKVLNLQ